MIREHVLTSSTLLALTALSGTAFAGPGITDKSYWPNEVGPSSYSRAPQTVPDRYRARAMQGGAPTRIEPIHPTQSAERPWHCSGSCKPGEPCDAGGPVT